MRPHSLPLLAGGLLVFACSAPVDRPGPMEETGGSPTARTGGAPAPKTGGAAPSTSGGAMTAGGSGGGMATGGATATGGAPSTTGGSTADAASTSSDAKPADAASAPEAASSSGDGGYPGLGGLGPLSPDDSPPLVLPGSALIFDGKSLDGWMCNTTLWSIKDASINGKGNGNNFCLTAGDYDTFRLTGKSRMVQNPSNHAGICWWGSRSQSGGGCLQMTPASGSMWDYSGGEVRTYPRVFDYTKWNFFELVVNIKTGTVMIAVNGHPYPTYTDKKLGSRKKGPIGLQLHAGFSELEYKDLALEANPKEDRLLTIIPGK